MSFKPEDSIGFLIGQSGRMIRSRIHQFLKQAGFEATMEQGGILMRLFYKDGQSQNELTNFLGKDKTTVARLIDVMEKSSLVVRVTDKNDKRSKQVYLTQKGKDMQVVVKESIIKTLEESLTDLPKEEIEIAKKVLRKIYENLNHHNNDDEDCGYCK